MMCTVHIFVTDLEDQVDRLKIHLDSLAQLVRACDILGGDIMKQLPLAAVGNFLETLGACNQTLCELNLQDAKLLKVVDRLALHNAKLKLLLPSPKPDISPTR